MENITSEDFDRAIEILEIIKDSEQDDQFESTISKCLIHLFKREANRLRLDEGCNED